MDDIPHTKDLRNTDQICNVPQIVVPIVAHRIGAEKLLVDEDFDPKSTLLNKFSAKIFSELPRSEKNHAVSPVNLYASFAMLYLGSNGETYFDLKDFLKTNQITPPFDDDTAFKAIQGVLQVLAYERYKLCPNYDLFNVIRILVDEKANYSDKYRISIKRYFNVDIDRIDFKRDFDLIGRQITELIKNDLNTKNIQDFQTKIDNRTQLMVLSAVRFKSKWEILFPLSDIKEEYFHSSADRQTTVQMMSIIGLNFGYGFVTKWDAHIFEIPLASQSMVFIGILPKTLDGLGKVWDGLNYQSISEAIESLHKCRCDIFLPKFKLECDYDFAKIYNKLKVFNTSGELSKISGQHPIKANNILQKVVFEINDNGVKPPEQDFIDNGSPQVIRADHPFLFIVKDTRTKSWVFFGQIHSL